MSPFTFALGHGVAFLEEHAWGLTGSLLALALLAFGGAWWEARALWQSGAGHPFIPWGHPKGKASMWGALLGVVCMGGLMWLALRPATWAGEAGDLLAVAMVFSPMPRALLTFGQALKLAVSGGHLRQSAWRAELQVLGPKARLSLRPGRPSVVLRPELPEQPWGNFLIQPGPPTAGDRPAWEKAFRSAFAAHPKVKHLAFAWNAPVGEEGEAAAWVADGYLLERGAHLVAHGEAGASLAAGPQGWALRPLQGEVEWALATQMQTRARYELGESLDLQAFRVRQMHHFRKAVAEGRAIWLGAFEGDRLVANVGLFAQGPIAELATEDSAWVLQAPALAWTAWVPTVGPSFLASVWAWLRQQHQAEALAFNVAEEGPWHLAALGMGFGQVERCRRLWKPEGQT